MSTSQKDYKSYLGDIEKLAEEYLVKKAPALPDGVKDVIVKFGPWISLILMVTMSTHLPKSLFEFFYGSIYEGLMVNLIIIVMEVIALPGLFKRAKAGWTMMCYIGVVYAVQNLVAFNWGGLVIGTLLGLYVLFQVKSYYK